MKESEWCGASNFTAKLKGVNRRAIGIEKLILKIVKKLIAQHDSKRVPIWLESATVV